ncbi:MAG: anthranilate phosphoribosyltransferase [Planctomycetaceae bacterium]|nr:anthranilate phosphoribosyltransferase [Planctomycetaceae bacterium]
MQPEIRAALDTLFSHQSLDRNSVQEAIGAIMDGRCEPVEISALLTAFAMKGETETEIAGAAAAMRERAIRIPTAQTGLIDTCGTGGDNLHTFNISTAAALVVAATGQPVAKHGNRSVSSSSGSADVLESLGVNIDLSVEQAGRCLDDVGICFCYARVCHQAMKHVAPVRAALARRTIFNLLGPLTNPARADYQLIGAFRADIARKLAGAISKLGTKRTLVVCGNDQLDEVSLWGITQVFDVQGESLTDHLWTAETFGLPECRPEQLRVSSAGESADVIRKLIAGEESPAFNMVLANAAAALFCGSRAETPAEGVDVARHAIQSGLVSQKLEELREWTQSVR